VELLLGVMIVPLDWLAENYEYVVVSNSSLDPIELSKTRRKSDEEVRKLLSGFKDRPTLVELHSDRFKFFDFLQRGVMKKGFNFYFDPLTFQEICSANKSFTPNRRIVESTAPKYREQKQIELKILDCVRAKNQMIRRFSGSENILELSEQEKIDCEEFNQEYDILRNLYGLTDVGMGMLASGLIIARQGSPTAILSNSMRLVGAYNHVVGKEKISKGDFGLFRRFNKFQFKRAF
jgi:hypothetical protein